MKTFKFAVAFLVFLIIGIWLWRIVSLNNNTPRQTVNTFAVGDTVTYGPNYNYSASEDMSGYAVEVLSANVYGYEDYLLKMNIPIESAYTWHPDFLFVVEIRVFNYDNPAENGGVIDLIDTYLASSDTRLSADRELLGKMYPQLGDSPTGFRIRPGTDMVMNIPFKMDRIAWLYTNDEEEYLRTNSFYLNLTQYPVKQVIKMKDGDCQ